jgi:hypothetical protein
MPASTSHSPAVDRLLSKGRTQEGAMFEGAPDGVRRLTGPSLGERHAWLFALVAWAPLILLAVLQSAYSKTDDVRALLWDIGVHARYLVAVPLLVLAGRVSAPQLDSVVRHFMRSRIVDETDTLKRAITSTQMLLASPAAGVVVVVLAYASVAAVAFSHDAGKLPLWATSGGITPIYSPAGWWYLLVSLPLLLLLIFGWIWRLALWTRLLWRISRLELRLVASHPDRCGGLSFLGQSVRAFAILALALASIVAARSAHLVLEGASLPTSNLYFSVGLMLAMMALFVAPLFVFTPVLMRTWRRGSLAYGALAGQIGSAFEDKWLEGRTSDEAMLSEPDFSATADLYAVAANVQSIRFVPVGLKDLTLLAGATALPFLPVLLLAVPMSQILSDIKDLLF